MVGAAEFEGCVEERAAADSGAFEDRIKAMDD
jgi:hypothetical protein